MLIKEQATISRAGNALQQTGNHIGIKKGYLLVHLTAFASLNIIESDICIANAAGNVNDMMKLLPMISVWKGVRKLQ